MFIQIKIKKIISLYLFTLSLTLLGSEILDKEILDEEMIVTMKASLLDQHLNPLVTEQNLEYQLSQLEDKLTRLSKTLEEKAYIIFFHFNTQIKSLDRGKKNYFDEYNNIQEQIKSIMNFIPHEVLDNDQINKLTHFTSMWASIQREKSKIIDPLKSREEKIIEEATISKIEKIESDIKIYNKALSKVNQYIKENNLKEDQIIDPREKQKRQKEEQIKKRNEEYERQREERNKKQEEEKALEEVAKFEREEQERRRIERENDPRLKEIQKIKEKIHKKVIDYFDKKDFENAIKKAKAKDDYNKTALKDIQEKIENIMKCCPHEFFTEENIQKTYPQIKSTFEQAQRERSVESKIFNPTEKNQENLKKWKDTLGFLVQYIFFENQSLPLRLGFTTIKLKAAERQKYDIGIGFLIGLGIIGTHNNFFKQSSRKKIDFLKEALIISGFALSGKIGGKYYYRIKNIFQKN